MNLDENDVNILKVLQTNGRLSFRQISEKVKVSVPTVSNKIGNMEALGVIKGYKADIDPERLGELSIVLTIKTKPSDLRKVADQFVNWSQVREVFILSNGKLLLVCTFTNSHWINDFVNTLGGIPEIHEYEISNIVSVVKENQRAVITPGLSVVLLCSECQREIREESTKVRMNGRDYHLCSSTCLHAFESRLSANK